MRAASLQRINFYWFLTLGVTALAAGLLVYLLLLESALGAFQIKEASPANLGISQNPTVGILKSASSRSTIRRLFPTGVDTARYDRSLVAWDSILSDRVKKKNIISLLDPAEQTAGSSIVSDISALSGAEHDVLILPSAVTLSDGQVRQIKEFLDEGGSVLVSWSAGMYAGDQVWRGWGFLEEAMGISFEKYIDFGRGDYKVAVDTLTARLDSTGQSITQVVAQPGIYIPKHIYDTMEVELVASMSARNTAELHRNQRLAAAQQIPALKDYVWLESDATSRPRFDFISVAPDTSKRDQTLTPGSIVSYFTWVGDPINHETPFPKTRAAVKRISLRGNTPLTAGIPGGYRAKVQIYTPGVEVRISDPSRAHSAGFWYDFATDEPQALNVLEPASGIVYGTKGKGRFVFMGFGPDALRESQGDPRDPDDPGDPEDTEVWTRLYDNILNYLQRKPIAWPHDWPHGNTAAAMITTNLLTSSQNVDAIEAFFEEENIPGTIFADERVAQDSPDLISRFYDRGDVGVYDPREKRLVGTTDTRRVRLRSFRQTLVDIVGGPIYGYRSARSGQLDDNTMEALALEGFQYIVPDSIGRRTTPKIMGRPFESLTRMGITTHELEHQKILESPSSSISIDSLLLSDAYRAIDEGGVARLTIPNALFQSQDKIDALSRLVNRLRQEDLWIASGREIARWWRLRKGLNVAVEQRSKSRIFVRVSNDNGDTAEEATVSILLGDKVDSVNIRPELINILKPVADDIDIPPYEIREDHTVLELKIRQLKPQQYRIFHIDLVSSEPDTTNASN